jgi:hypothetical protein
MIDKWGNAKQASPLQSYAGQKGQDFIRGDGFQFPVTKFI